MNATPALRQRTLQRLAPSSLVAALFLFATLGLLWFILCRNLSLEWSSNEQYSYGWFVPFFALFLFWLRWEDWGKVENGKLTAEIRSPSRQAELRKRSRAGCPPYNSVLCLLASVLLLLLFPIRLFEIANPDWRPLSWVHALTVVGLTLLVIGYWGGRAAVRHFAFPVCFLLVAVPWITPIEAPLVQWLMRIVAAVATETLTLFGIPAQLEGSLIRVNNTVVGVSEACSGVRSLQTSLMIGLLFGELKRLTIGRRCLLVGAALGIALLANFGRAIFLVYIAATQNIAAVEHWHDTAGYAIVGAVFLGTIAIASAIAPHQTPQIRSQKSEPPPDLSSPVAAPPPSSVLRPLSSHRRLPRFHFSVSVFSVSAFLWLLLIEVSVTAWYRAHERRLVPSRQWTVQWPESAPGFSEMPIDDHTREMLRYDDGRQATWSVTGVVRGDSPAPPSLGARAEKAFLFFFRWEPGTATVLRARAHRPDICLPAVGWRPIGEPGVRSYPVAPDFNLPFQHFSFVHDEPGGRALYAETFFCLREDRVRPGTKSGDETIPFSHWSIPERWDAVRNGMRNPGQQVMEFVLLSRQPRSAAEAREEFGELLPSLVALKD